MRTGSNEIKGLLAHVKEDVVGGHGRCDGETFFVPRGHTVGHDGVCAIIKVVWYIRRPGGEVERDGA